MIKVGFITSPLSSGHAVRGVGFYTKNLLIALKTLAESQGFEIVEMKNLPDRQVGSRLKIIHYPFFDLFYHSLPLLKAIPTVVTIHDVIPLDFPDHYPPGYRGALNFQLQKLSLKNVSRIMTDSYTSVNSLRKYLSVPDSKLRLVYLAPAPHFQPLKDANFLAAVKKKYALPEKFILYVGDINYPKNIPGLVSACQAAKLPLVIIGKQAAHISQLDLSHPELSHLKFLLNQLSNNPSQIYLHGFVPDADLVAIYNLATIYCQPSFAEGFGLPVLEAFACGTPVACSKTGSLAEIAGNASAFFDPYNISDMAGCLTKLFSDSAGRIRLAKAGSKRVKQFSWEKTATQVLQVYHEV